MEAPKSVSFLAAFPDIQSAFSMDGRGDGARIKLDIPRSDVDAVVLLHQFCTGKPLKITVEILSGDCLTENNNGVGKGKKRQSKWKATEASSVD